MRKQIRITPSTLIIALGALVLFGVASAPAPTVPNPALIAVVRLDAVIDGLNERDVKQVEFDRKQSEFKDRMKQLEDQLKDKSDALDVLPAGESRAEMIHEIESLRATAQFEQKWGEAELNTLYANMLRDLFRSVDAAVDVMAQREGYTLVISSDDGVEVGGATPVDVLKSTSRRRLLYVDQRHDITEDVVAYMNNQFAAGQP